MKTQIRDAVFETNSSSSHSVTVSAGELRDFNISKESWRSGVIRAEVSPHGYGWQWVRFYKPENVLGYLLYQATQNIFRAGQATGVDLSGKIRADERARFILETVEKATGCKVEFVFPKVADSHFYIDHESGGVGLEFARPGREDDLLRIVFDTTSYIELGNDNSPPGEYVESDIGDILVSPDRYVDDPISDEASFEVSFSTGFRDSDCTFVGSDGEKLEGSLEFGRIGQVVHEMRDVTVTEVMVQMAAGRVRGMDSSTANFSAAAREVFFQWLSRANNIEPYAEDPTDHASVCVLRDMRFTAIREPGDGSYRLTDDRTRITIKGSAPASVVEKMTAVFEEMATIPSYDYGRS